MKPIKNQTVRYKEIDGRAILIQPENGQVHEFNPVATFLWNHADGSHALDTLREKLIASFDVEPSQAAEDISEFFTRLGQAGLIQWVTSEA